MGTPALRRLPPQRQEDRNACIRVQGGVPLKVNVFFDRAGRPLHALYKKADADGRYRTMCGKPVPAFFRLSARHACNADNLGLQCPECCATLGGLIQRLEEEERAIYEPT